MKVQNDVWIYSIFMSRLYIQVCIIHGLKGREKKWDQKNISEKQEISEGKNKKKVYMYGKDFTKSKFIDDKDGDEFRNKYIDNSYIFADRTFRLDPWFIPNSPAKVRKSRMKLTTATERLAQKNDRKKG